MQSKYSFSTNILKMIKSRERN